MSKCMIMNSTEFAGHIKKLLKQNKMTYKELALKLNMEPSKLSSTLRYRTLMSKQQLVSEICKVLDINEVIIVDNNYNNFIINPDPDHTIPEYMVISEVEFANMVRARMKTRRCKYIDSISDKLHLSEKVISNIFNGVPKPCQYTSIDALLNVCKYYAIDPSEVFKNEFVEMMANEKQKFISSLKFILKNYDISEGDIAKESRISTAMILKILRNEYYPPKSVRDSIHKAIEKAMSQPKIPENKKDTMVSNTKELDIIKKNKKMTKLRKKIKSLDDEDFMELASWIFTLAKKRARKRKKK